MLFFCYTLRCKDGYLYTGITWNISKRLAEHKSGKVPNTKNRLPIELVYQEGFKTRKEAVRREKEIKGWRREKKENLIKIYTKIHKIKK